MGLLETERRRLSIVTAYDDPGNRFERRRVVRNLDSIDCMAFADYEDDAWEVDRCYDALACPATNDVFGLVSFEALTYGTPVIVGDDSGCREMVEETDCGYLVKYCDVDGLREKIEYVLLHGAEGREKAERGRRFILQRLAGTKLLQQLKRSTRNVSRTSRHRCDMVPLEAIFLVATSDCG